MSTPPSPWSQYASDGSSSSFSVAAGTSEESAPNVLNTTSGSTGLTAWAWNTSAQSPNAEVSAGAFLTYAVPLEVMARGTNLGAASPSYYAASVTNGPNVQLLKVVGGQSRALATLAPASGYLTGAWVQVSLYVNGNNLRAQVYRPDTGQYLNSGGQWQALPAWALNITDTTLTGAGFAGLVRVW